jgi:hypothetical protein
MKLLCLGQGVSFNDIRLVLSLSIPCLFLRCLKSLSKSRLDSLFALYKMHYFYTFIHSAPILTYFKSLCSLPLGLLTPLSNISALFLLCLPILLFSSPRKAVFSILPDFLLATIILLPTQALPLFSFLAYYLIHPPLTILSSRPLYIIHQRRAEVDDSLIQLSIFRGLYDTLLSMETSLYQHIQPVRESSPRLYHSNRFYRLLSETSPTMFRHAARLEICDVVKMMG